MNPNSNIRLRDLWRAHTLGWTLSYLLGAVALVCTVLLLAFSGWFISAAALAGVAAIQAGSFNYLRPGAVIRFFAIFRTAGRYAERLQSHHTVLALLKTLRLQSFQQLSQQSSIRWSLLVRPGSADVLQRLIADLDLLDQFPLKVLLPWGWALLAGAGYGVALWLLAPAALPAAMLVLLLMLVVWPLLLQRVGIRLAQQEVQAHSRRREHLLNALQLLTTLLLFGRWSASSQHLQQQDQQIAQLQQKLQWLMLAAQFGSQVLLLSGLLCIGVMSTPLVLLNPIDPTTASAALHPAVWVALLLGWLGLAEVLAPLAQLHSALGYSLAARDRLNQLLLADPPISGAAAVLAPPMEQNLAQQQLLPVRQFQINQLQPGFTKPLPGVSPLTQQLLPGDCVLLQAPSGTGKSCLLLTLAGDLAPYGGDIRFNDVPLANLTAYTQHQLIGLLPQRPQLFQLTIAAELRLAQAAASDQQLYDVLALTGLSDWLQQQPAGLSTVLGQEGVGLSGGELRRFALARLLLLNTPVLLLDEPFAGLDQQRADQLLSALAARYQDKILIIASHQQLQHPAFNRHWSLTGD